MLKKFVLVALVAVLAASTISVVTLGGNNNKLIIYHWWTAGGEKNAIDALLNLYHVVYPNIEIVQNPTAGGGGGTMRAAIKTMILAGNAPDTFQLTYGTGMLRSWVNVLQPIDNLWAYFPVPPMIKQMGTINGHQYAIPLNIMRNNTLWYNKKLVAKLGIHIPLNTLDDFFAACKKIKAAGYIPYAVGAGAGQEFWLGEIFDMFVLAVPDGGPQYLEKLFAGKADPLHDPAIREALAALKELKDNGYINSDWDALTWDQAGDLVASGKAVFCQMGDWMEGHFKSLGLKPGIDFDYQPSPGTNGIFVIHFDSFVLPKGAPHPLAAEKWLSLLTTKEAETVFCPLKGATPPRLDAFTDMYDSVSQKTLAAFRNPKTIFVQSEFAGPPESWLGTYGSMLSGFLENPNLDQGVKAFADAYATVFGQ